ncbi:MFS transporter [Robbsia andropogonis]|uniref:MFS transporter n=1 Tax=Robbsia andropogonis TaxID=28092 RepID=UPI00209C73DC|nr:MFS transporter [Robbsia andropogonis]MCP1118568.1 MFS transporter [Robbsia andropogonis]MCP1128035.1 MFS transporter [Robbsia andropogonis]
MSGGDVNKGIDVALFAPRPGTPNQVLAIVCAGMILANLDLFIVNVGLPSISQELHEEKLDNLSWILNAYTVTYASLLVFFGRAAERYRRDVTFLLGVGLFTVASAACAAAGSVEMLAGFRIIQAAAAALMTPTSLGLLLATFPPEKRGAAVRTWTAIGGVAAALGPLVGGLLVVISWRWIFLVNVPIGIVALALGWWRLPPIPGHHARKPDALSAFLVTVGIACLTFAIVKVNDWGWRAVSVQINFYLSVLLLGGFVFRCFTTSNPLIEPGLFKNRAFAGASLVMAPFSAAFGALLLSVVLWEQLTWKWSALMIGATMAPGPLLVPVVSLLFSKHLIQRFGASNVIIAGTTSFALGLIWWSCVPGTQPEIWIAVAGMIPIGVGVGLTLPTLMGVGTSSLPATAFSTGSAAINMIRQAAIAIGVAVLVALVGAHANPIDSFKFAWRVMAVITMMGVIPTLLLIRRSRTP